MAEFAAQGKSSVGWFMGSNGNWSSMNQGELMEVEITAGNVDDRDSPLELAQSLFGKLFGDRDYISQPLFEQLGEQGVQLDFLKLFQPKYDDSDAELALF
ncbi:Transposase DDE domain-containing protein [Nitrosomonas communis]|uniref:Transposase DDE domain-containing protein n=1 Tax=Nitrosomonas communis TaxID=44574 RepID=A0A1I4TSH8_9PROT|nr:Transposase DDE domain-containing protein [Nitrosomonas communis]